MKKYLIIAALLWASPAHAAITAAQCTEIRNAVAQYGSFLVTLGARARGYTAAQIAYARKACHV